MKTIAALLRMLVTILVAAEGTSTVPIIPGKRIRERLTMPKLEPFVADMIYHLSGDKLVIFHRNPLRSTLSDIQNNSDGVTVPSHVWATLGCVGGTGFNLGYFTMNIWEKSPVGLTKTKKSV